ncbi:hypothetical protein MD484_g6045, partial [Candolleomyces efflorescens]
MDRPSTSAPAAALARSNAALTEQAHLMAKLTDLLRTRAQIDKLSTEVHQKSSEVTHLCTRYVRTVDVLNVHGPTLSPIRRVPLDVLRMIFRFTVSPEGEWEWEVVGRDATSMRISQVCEEWRDLALKCPFLWCCFTIPMWKYTFPHASYWTGNSVGQGNIDSGDSVEFHSPDHESYVRRCKNVLELVQVWVSRSGNRGLEWALDARDIITGFEDLTADGDFDHDEVSLGLEKEVFTPVVPLLDFMIQHSDRWVNVRLALPMVCTLTAFSRVLEVQEEEAPLLQKLDLVLDYTLFATTPHLHLFEHEDLMHPNPPSNSNSNPKSFVVKLILHPHVFPDTDVPLNWAYITDLTFSSSSEGYSPLNEWHSTCLLLLSLCAPSLVSCDMTMPMPSSRSRREPAPRLEQKPGYPYVLLWLRRLSVGRAGELPLGFFSECFLLPALEEVKLTSEYTDPTPEPRVTTQNPIVELLRTVGSTVRDATVHYTELTQSGLYECLKALREVRTLRLTGEGCAPAGSGTGMHAELNAEVFERMNEGRGMCRNLEHLWVRPGIRDTLFSQDALANFVCARRPVQAPSTPTGFAQLQSLKFKLLLLSEGDDERQSVKTALEKRRRWIEDLDAFVCVEEYVRERGVPSWMADTEDGDLEF